VKRQEEEYPEQVRDRLERQLRRARELGFEVTWVEPLAGAAPVAG
jgi:hypothetical protein